MPELPVRVVGKGKEREGKGELRITFQIFRGYGTRGILNEFMEISQMYFCL